MRGSLLSVLCLQSTLVASASVRGLIGDVTGAVADTLAPKPYSVQQSATDQVIRSAAITVKRAGFLYGPPVGGGPYFPTGVLGVARAAADQVLIQLDEAPVLANAALDSAKAILKQYDGLKTLDDYVSLYDGEWALSLPGGPAPGILTNFTQDLLFSMERLSISPYGVKRLDPAADSLAFQVDDDVTTDLSGSTLQELFQDGRLFYVDYRSQKNLTLASKYAAACDAYFYIDPKSEDFLPLAIRTNVGSNLIYTPKDDADDWLLAKLMYNVNDFWFSQWNHLASVHEVVQIVYMAAIRTLSDDHPVLAWVNRLMYETFAIMPLAQTILFPPGAIVDLDFAFTGQSAEAYSTNLYKNGGSGRFQSNYFEKNLESRGLLNSKTGPSLKSFPWYDDASTIYGSIQTFMTSFVTSYYSSDSAVAADKEIQAWVKEAQGDAEAIDFPDITTTASLVDVLTHLAHLVSSSHHTVNTNALITVSSTLPFHPPGLYKAIPTEKGNVNIVDYLPKLDKVVLQFSNAALFARPSFAGTNRTLLHMFDDSTTLGRMNDKTRTAAAKFKADMTTFSGVVSSRKFDSDGLSQGMPFLWQTLDPDVAPYSATS